MGVLPGVDKRSLTHTQFELHKIWISKPTRKKWVQNILASGFTNTKIFSLGWRSDQKYKSESIDTISISQYKQLIPTGMLMKIMDKRLYSKFNSRSLGYDNLFEQKAQT